MSAAWRAAAPWHPVLIAVAAGTLYLLGLDRYPQFDELYHVLAAQGWLATGTPRIAEGIYLRDSWYTVLVGYLFAHFGVSIEVARLPSVVAVAVLVGVLFVWLRREAGAAAAWIGAGLFAISPFAIEIAQFSRAYSFQMLGFFVGACASYRVVTRRRIDLAALAYALVAAAGLGLAFAIQVATAAGIAGLALWAALVLAGPWLIDTSVPLPRRLGASVAGLLLGVAGLAVLLHTGLLAEILAPLSETNLATAVRDPPFWFYHFLLILYYPTLWSLVPLLTLAALAWAPRPALFAACVFVVALLVHSIAAAKNLRYFGYAIPFLFVLWGIGIAPFVGAAAAVVAKVTTGAVRQLPPQLGLLVARAALIVGVVFVVLANAGSMRSATLLAGATIPPEVPPPRWQLARAALEPDLESAEVVVTSSELEQLFYLERYDVLYSRSRLAEVRPSTPFVIDWRTGRPIIGRAEDLALLMACFRTGLVVSPTTRWRSAAQIDNTAADLLTRAGEEIDLTGTGLVAYRWTRPVGTAASCPLLPTRPGESVPAS